ncbi:Clan S-, family S54, Rhomboid-like serine peptidase [Histomonas meleagridis]|uniref:Clan S, family S54, Rhomboid-like serine peptidase n=1 Tax=Histomonas meleagridis TaxID=135588 RepID=UPI003559D70D|nr:Clan S-, family S54, Rhomboid-like serine peptidase [Histomonas meleagridis]KAH0800154.1 Clan S, family S54, Rhomboid-like serine peptidase [Histomonas meleagridis]
MIDQEDSYDSSGSESSSSSSSSNSSSSSTKNNRPNHGTVSFAPPPFEQSDDNDNANWWDENVATPAASGISVRFTNAGSKPNSNRQRSSFRNTPKTHANSNRSGGGNPSRSRSTTFAAPNSHQNPRVRSTTVSGQNPNRQGNSRAIRPQSVNGSRQNRSRSVHSANSSTRGIQPTTLIHIQAPTPLIWTVGTTLIMLLVFVCEILQSGGFKSMSVNPMFGPDESTMIQMGAKYGPLVIGGDIWRIITAIFVQNGIISFVITVILVIFTRKIERDAGFWKAFILFFISGTYGYIASCLFVSSAVSCGATGTMLGYVGMLLGDLIASWKTTKRPVLTLIGMILAIIILLAVGITPYVDNFSHVGGFVMGFLFALMMLPNLNFGKCQRFCHGAVAFLAFPVMSVLYMVTLVLFFRNMVDDNWCRNCYLLNCVNITGWCHQID